MQYPEKYEFTANVAAKAIDHMKQRDIPLNPHNFMIWYEYSVGRNGDLKDTVDGALSEHMALTPQRSEEIYSSFFGPTDATARTREWNKRIEAAAGRILDAVANVGENTETYGHALKSFSGDIAGATSATDVKSLITDILVETKTMDAQIATLQTRVHDASAEITTLKQDLERAQRDALTDGLTGVANRKCFNDTLAAAIEDARANSTALSLIILDLDHFKAFNDSHGHQVGDQVLKLLGQTLVQCVKGQDTAARYGGEEFAVILPNTTLDGAVAVAENIRRSIGEKKLVKKGTVEEIGSITVSAGVSQCAPGDDMEQFVERADRALYKAKELGRNLVAFETEKPETVAAG